jgi:hypothetical protein
MCNACSHCTCNAWFRSLPEESSWSRFSEHAADNQPSIIMGIAVGLLAVADDYHGASFFNRLLFTSLPVALGYYCTSESH